MVKIIDLKLLFKRSPPPEIIVMHHIFKSFCEINFRIQLHLVGGYSDLRQVSESIILPTLGEEKIYKVKNSTPKDDIWRPCFLDISFALYLQQRCTTVRSGSNWWPAVSETPAQHSGQLTVYSRSPSTLITMTSLLAFQWSYVLKARLAIVRR